MDAQGTTPQGRGVGISAEEVWSYFSDVDSLDPQAVVAHYAASGRFRFANQPPAVGHGAIRQVLSGFYATLRAMNHRNTGLWLGELSAVFEAEVDFTLRDGRVVTVPAVSVLRREGQRVIDFRFVMDAAPLQVGAAGGDHADP